MNETTNENINENTNKESEKDKIIKNRYDFIYMFDATNSNPNGDPDTNLPRIDPYNGKGIVTDVCLKHKIRSYMEYKNLDPNRFDIFIRDGESLNDKISKILEPTKKDITDQTIAEDSAEENSTEENSTEEKTKNKKSKNKKKTDKEIVNKRKIGMCNRYWDIRTFGAVMSTGDNAGQVQGPVQINFATSIDPIELYDYTITKCVETTTEDNKGEGRMGRKVVIPYGLYVARGFISPNWAYKSGFTEGDLDLFWESLINMLEIDKAAGRNFLSMKKLIVFKHDSNFGNAPASELFKLLHVESLCEHTRRYEDYKVSFDRTKIPEGIHVAEISEKMLQSGTKLKYE